MENIASSVTIMSGKFRAITAESSRSKSGDVANSTNMGLSCPARFTRSTRCLLRPVAIGGPGCHRDTHRRAYLRREADGTREPGSAGWQVGQGSDLLGVVAHPGHVLRDLAQRPLPAARLVPGGRSRRLVTECVPPA